MLSINDDQRKLNIEKKAVTQIEIDEPRSNEKVKKQRSKKPKIKVKVSEVNLMNLIERNFE